MTALRRPCFTCIRIFTSSIGVQTTVLNLEKIVKQNGTNVSPPGTRSKLPARLRQHYQRLQRAIGLPDHSHQFLCARESTPTSAHRHQTKWHSAVPVPSWEAAHLSKDPMVHSVAPWTQRNPIRIDSELLPLVDERVPYLPKHRK